MKYIKKSQSEIEKDRLECERIKIILDQRYSNEAMSKQVPSEDVYIDDLKRFINFVNKKSGPHTIFSNYCIFQGQDGLWKEPHKIFIDTPYLDSGLSSVFALLEDKTKTALSLVYEDYQIETASILSFAKKLVQYTLQFVRTCASENPESDYLSGVGGERRMGSGINQDFDIEGLVQLCKASSEEISKAILNTLNEYFRTDYLLKATFSLSTAGGQRQADAMFIHTLRSEAWVPQGGGRFVKPSEASSTLLPKGFAFNAELLWVNAVNLGEDVRKDPEKQTVQDEWAKEALGTANKEKNARANTPIYVEQMFKILDFNFDLRIKLVRHVGQDSINIKELISNDQFDFYQAYQDKGIFDNTDWILSFLAEEGSRAIFHGAFKVLGTTKLQLPKDYPYPEHFNELKNFQYDLQRDEQFDIFRKRLVIEWNNPISWHQHFRPRSKKMIEMLPEGYVSDFPGHNNVKLSYEELSALVNNPIPNRVWHQNLSNVKGIYLILCTQTGKQYVGSATGTDGIWNRWGDYVVNGHGGNNGLREHLNQYPGAAIFFQFSILETFSAGTARGIITAREHQIIKHLGTDKWGLNHNQGD